MGYKRLYIWVEGPDDERFFNQIIKPILLEKYDDVETIILAEKTRFIGIIVYNISNIGR